MTKRLVALLTLWFLLCAGLSAFGFKPGHLSTDRDPVLPGQAQGALPADLGELSELAAEPDTPSENALSAEPSDWPDASIRASQTARLAAPAVRWPHARPKPLAAQPPELPRRPPRLLA